MIEQWDSKKHDVDWRVFQQEYRDYLDVVKLFQLLPVVGAAVGGAIINCCHSSVRRQGTFSFKNHSSRYVMYRLFLCFYVSGVAYRGADKHLGVVSIAFH